MTRWILILLLLAITLGAKAQGDYKLEPVTQPVLVKDSAGIETIQKEFRLKILRKANKDLLIIKVQKLDDRNMDFKLTNLIGEELAVEVECNRHCSIDLSLLPPGGYILNIYDFDSGKLARIKINKGKP